MNTTSTQRQAELFRALMHPARLAILNMLRDGEACVCHLEAHLGYRQAYLSQQLAILRTAGLIHDRRVGWNIYYEVSQPEVFTLLDLSLGLVGVTTNDMHAQKGSPDCPCPKCAGKIEQRLANDSLSM
jgi:DNA-binding transcriptional ArsR family regulator